MANGAAKLAYLMGKLTPAGSANFGAIMGQMDPKGAANFGTFVAHAPFAKLDELAETINHATPESIKAIAIALGSSVLADSWAGSMDARGCLHYVGWAAAILGGLYLIAMIIMFFSPTPADSTPEQHRLIAIIGGSLCGLFPMVIGIVVIVTTRR